MRLRGKAAIVTGAATGIGKAIALAFASEGARVVVDYRDVSTAADAVVREITGNGGTAIALRADVTKASDVEALVNGTEAAFGGVDVIVNNAGVEEKHPFLEMPFDVFQRVIDVNLTGVWLCSQYAARAMVRRGSGGRIITISSIHEDVAMPMNAPYCAAKGAVRMLTRTIAVELAPHGITANDVCPGAIETPMDANIERQPEKLRALLSEIPLRRMGKPEEVAELCVYLASDAAAYVTGASFTIDGGMMRSSGSL